MAGLSAPAGRHAAGHGRDQSFDSQELAVADLEQLAYLERKGLVEGRVHGMHGTVIVNLSCTPFSVYLAFFASGSLEGSRASAAFAAFAQAQNGACDRACLEGFVNQYLAAHY